MHLTSGRGHNADVHRSRCKVALPALPARWHATRVSLRDSCSLPPPLVTRPLVNFANDTELYVASVGSPEDRNAHTTAYTTFHHIRRDGGVTQVPLHRVLQSKRLGVVVLNHMDNADQCFWYRMAKGDDDTESPK